ncbi:probable cytochrome P450 6a14 isoform X2 [Anoplophora glabripennis]|uniref:probable cytochrome P450 6a14 isoform X2 n=1 Tax=Anoplophora glabripennis TaxID=217634 RepID=UPI000873AAD9|nr:probable cytochrome P450 6a14 isoform X2 [Anoplophora glabripennis]
MISCLVTTLLNALGVVAALLAVVYAYFKWTYQYWKSKNVPHVEPTIPFGNTGNPFTQPRGQNIANMYHMAKEKGWKYCGLYTLLSPIFLVVDIDLVKTILTKDFQYFTDRGQYTNEKDDPVGCHLFALGGSKWRNMRTKLTPTFTSGKLKAMFQTLVDCGLVLEEYIEENIKPEESVDIKEVLACFSTDVIGSCAFGLDCNSFKEPNSAFRRYGNTIFTIDKLVALKVLFCGTFPTLARMLGVRQVSRDTADFFTKVVEDTVSYREKNNVVRKDFLQLLMDIRNTKDGQENGNGGDGNSLTLNEMVAQSFVFFVAGFETSSTTMTFALFELATNPDMQERLRDEINEVLARHEGKVTYDSLSEMKYLGQVIDETLRVHSPARLLRRVCNTDYKVPGEDLVIEKGTSVIVSVRGIHYDEEFWENPKEFDPERFSEEKKKNMNQYTHLPFGQGPRMCIGERFGVMQTKVGLTCLLRKFRVKLDKKTKLPLKMSSRTLVNSAEGGIWLNLEKI